MKSKEIKKAVKKGYGSFVQGTGGCCNPLKTCFGTEGVEETISRNVGYKDDEMRPVPKGANLGLGCGNSVALASLKKGRYRY